MIKYTGILVFLILNGIGFLLLRQAIAARRMGKIAQKWPNTSAIILETSITEEPGRNAMGSVNVDFRVNTLYEYTVNGKVYQGSRVSFGKPVFDYVTASNVNEQFAVGKQVTAWYDPENPQEAVLAPKTTVGMLSRIPGIFLMIAGVVVGLMAILLN